MRSAPQITVRHIGEISIFDITGYFTEDSAEGMNAAYDQSVDSAKILLCFDQQSFITSSGFGVIVKLIWKTRNKRQILQTEPSLGNRYNLYSLDSWFCLSSSGYGLVLPVCVGLGTFKLTRRILLSVGS